MLRPDTSASNSSFFARLSIDELTSSVDFTPEIGVANGLFRDEIDRPSEKTLQLFRKREVTIGIGGVRLPIRHLYDEIEVARRRPEPPRGGRPEEIETLNAVPTAKLCQLAPLLLNQH